MSLEFRNERGEGGVDGGIQACLPRLSIDPPGVTRRGASVNPPRSILTPGAIEGGSRHASPGFPIRPGRRLRARTPRRGPTSVLLHLPQGRNVRFFSAPFSVPLESPPERSLRRGLTELDPLSSLAKPLLDPPILMPTSSFGLIGRGQRAHGAVQAGQARVSSVTEAVGGSHASLDPWPVLGRARAQRPTSREPGG